MAPQVQSRCQLMKPLFLLGLALFSGATLAADLKPFEASFAVSRNGKELGTMAMTLSAPKEGDWLFVSRTEGKGGLAGFLGVTIEERSTLTLGESGLASTSYRYNQDMVGRHRARQLEIAGGKATESDDDKRWSYAVEGNVLDRHSMVLGIATHLADGVSEGSVFDLASKTRQEAGSKENGAPRERRGAERLAGESEHVRAQGCASCAAACKARAPQGTPGARCTRGADAGWPFSWLLLFDHSKRSDSAVRPKRCCSRAATRKVPVSMRSGSTS
jgi:hypothetical protein